MKVLVIGDLHAYPWGMFPLTAKGENQYLSQVQDLLQVQAPRIIRQYGIDLVILLGDLADEPYRRGKIGVSTQNALIESLRKLRDDTHTRIAVIAGNHDCYAAGSSWLPALSDVITFGAVGEPLLLPNDVVGGPPLCFVPYANPNVVDQWLALLPDDAIVFGHFAYQGARMGWGKAIDDESAVPTTHLKRFRYSMLGHIHMASDNPRHSYVGIPIPYSWSCQGQGQVVVLDTLADPFTFDRIPMHYPMFVGPDDPCGLRDKYATKPTTAGTFVRAYWTGTAPALKESLLQTGTFPEDIRVFPVPRQEIRPEDGKTSTPRSEITGSVVSAATTSAARSEVLASYIKAKQATGGALPCEVDDLLAIGLDCIGLERTPSA